jgi:hypothetical protein
LRITSGYSWERKSWVSLGEILLITGKGANWLKMIKGSEEESEARKGSFFYADIRLCVRECLERRKWESEA